MPLGPTSHSGGGRVDLCMTGSGTGVARSLSVLLSRSMENQSQRMSTASDRSSVSPGLSGSYSAGCSLSNTRGSGGLHTDGLTHVAFDLNAA
jgi:hypothetical protein